MDHGTADVVSELRRLSDEGSIAVGRTCGHFCLSKGWELRCGQSEQGKWVKVWGQEVKLLEIGYL